MSSSDLLMPITPSCTHQALTCTLHVCMHDAVNSVLKKSQSMYGQYTTNAKQFLSLWTIRRNCNRPCYPFKQDGQNPDHEDAALSEL